MAGSLTGAALYQLQPYERLETILSAVRDKRLPAGEAVGLCREVGLGAKAVLEVQSAAFALADELLPAPVHGEALGAGRYGDPPGERADQIHVIGDNSVLSHQLRRGTPLDSHPVADTTSDAFFTGLWDRNLNRPEPVGTTVVMGGSIHHPDILKTVAEIARGDRPAGYVPTIGVVLSSKPSYEEAMRQYQQDEIDENGKIVDVSIEHWFQNAGFNPVPIPITIDHRDPAYDEQLAARVAALDAVYLCGGSQARHTSCLLTAAGEDTPLMAAIRTVQDRLAATGSSAGGAAAGAIQYGDGDVYEYLKSGGLARKPVTAVTLENEDSDRGSFQAGLGLLGHYGIVTCTHFGRRHRLGRLVVALREIDRARGLPAGDQRAFGLGVDEDTAVIVKDGVGTVVGKNGAFFVDTREAVWGEGRHFSVTGVRVTYLSAGDTVDLDTRRVTSTGTPSSGDGRTYNSEDLLRQYEAFFLMRGLARSSARSVTGSTRETDPRFHYVFSRDERTRAFTKGREFTMVDAVLDVVCEPGS